MEFILMCNGDMEFCASSRLNASKMAKVEWISKTSHSSNPLALRPVIYGVGGDHNADGNNQAFRENSIRLLFGDSDLTKDLTAGLCVPLTTHLTLTSSKTGRLIVKTKSETPEEGKAVDILEELFKLQERLPPNSIEFILDVSALHYGDWYNQLWLKEEGLKVVRNEGGSAILEMTNIKLPKNIFWNRWSAGTYPFYGDLALRLKLDIAAVIELYRKHYSGKALPTKVDAGAATDMVILVGGNTDKEKAIKCHKSVLTEMSPVFAAMFQADMVEAKEGTLEIVEFSEDCIRALMDFVYRRDLEETLKSSEMASELLQMAHKYQLQDLMDILLYIIWSMPCTWFSVDMVVKLFFFTKKVGKDLDIAEKKCWVVLRWFAEKFPEKLIESKASLNVMSENPRAVMELVVQLLKGKMK